MIAEAIEMHLELMQQSGESIPAPSTTYEFAVDESSRRRRDHVVDVAVGTHMRCGQAKSSI